MLEVQSAKIEITQLIVVHDVPLTRTIADNTAVVAAPLEIVRPLFLVTNTLEFNPAIVVIAQLMIKP